LIHISRLVSAKMASTRRHQPLVSVFVLWHN